MPRGEVRSQPGGVLLTLRTAELFLRGFVDNLLVLVDNLLEAPKPLWIILLNVICRLAQVPHVVPGRNLNAVAGLTATMASESLVAIKK